MEVAQVSGSNNDSQSPQVNELFTALAKAQGELGHAEKDSTNPHFKSDYASLASAIDASRKTLSKHGLAVIQTMQQSPSGWSLVTTLGHGSGQWIKSLTPILAARGDAQSFGSAVTYARRYGVLAIVNIAPDDDDDGNAASDGFQKKATAAQPPPPRPKQVDFPPRKDPAWKDEPATEPQRRRLWALCKENGIDEDHLKDMLLTAFGDAVVGEDGNVSTTLLTKSQIQTIFAELEGEEKP
jgi:hypothetical protein